MVRRAAKSVLILTLLLIKVTGSPGTLSMSTLVAMIIATGLAMCAVCSNLVFDVFSNPASVARARAMSSFQDGGPGGPSNLGCALYRSGSDQKCMVCMYVRTYVYVPFSGWTSWPLNCNERRTWPWLRNPMLELAPLFP